MMDDELEQDRLELANGWRAEWPADFDGDLSPEELAYLAYIKSYSPPLLERAEWELRDYTIERMEDFINFLRHRAVDNLEAK